jgi:DNA repair protein RecO
VYDHQYDEEIFIVAVKTLEAMDRDSEQCSFNFVRFLLMLASVLGYQVETRHCSQCDKPLQAAYYNSANGQLVCEACGRYLSPSNKISESDLDLLNRLQEPTAKVGFENYAPGDTGFDHLIRLLINYLAYHIGSSLNLKSLAILAEIERHEKQ